MQLYDKDLLSVQEVRELVEKAKAAQEELSTKSQKEVDRIVQSIAAAGETQDVWRSWPTKKPGLA